MLFTLFSAVSSSRSSTSGCWCTASGSLRLEDQPRQTALDQAIAERRAEATTRLSPSAPETVGALGSVEVARPMS